MFNDGDDEEDGKREDGEEIGRVDKEGGLRIDEAGFGPE